MSIMHKSAAATATIIGAAALAVTLSAPAWANSWDYGYGYGSTITQAHGAAVLDLVGTYQYCTNLSLVSDTYVGNGTWYAVEKGWCGAPR